MCGLVAVGRIVGLESNITLFEFEAIVFQSVLGRVFSGMNY